MTRATRHDRTALERSSETLALAALIFALPVGAGAISEADEYELKAAFLYQFTKYVGWPEEARDPVQICVLGDDPFGELLDTALAGKSTRGQPVVARRIRTASEVRACRILFVSQSERARLEPILAAVARHATLTVSDIKGFPHQGGMIRLKVEDDRIRLEINPDNAERVGLKIRSELLRLADIVRNEGD